MLIAELVFKRGQESLLQLRIDRAEMYIGSADSNDIVVPDESMPSVFARITHQGRDRFHIQDFSDGLLCLNEERLPDGETMLRVGDKLTVGRFTLEFNLRTASNGRKYLGSTAVLGRDRDDHSHAELKWKNESIELSTQVSFNIGSHEDNQLVLDDPFVSAFHCRIDHSRGRWQLTDLGSTNGTRVNGLRVGTTELPPEARITMGQVELSFHVETPSAPPNKAVRKTTHGMIAESLQMRQVIDLIDRFANNREPVLVVGESGSGKELVSRALHEASQRRPAPYLALNCGALASSLIEGELFGHVRGAFTGATHDKVGAFEAASEGTLFLDEIGELPPDLQPKLLRVLETSTVRRVGGIKEVPINTRIVAATHRNLEQLVQEGSFREDLFHRLFVLSIRIPPLRERPEDISALAEHFVQTHSSRPITISSAAHDALARHSWPGNIRELRNVLVRAMAMTDATILHPSDLQFAPDTFASHRTLRRSLRTNDVEERKLALRVLGETNWNRAEAARRLGISKSTFHDKLKRWGIEKPR